MSWPAMELYFPSRRNPVNRTTIRRGFFFCSTVVGSRPSFSSTPGRNGSISTSLFVTKDNKMSTDCGSFRSRAIEDLCEVNRSFVGVGWALGRSMRRTLAPQLASNRPQKGPAKHGNLS